MLKNIEIYTLLTPVPLRPSNSLVSYTFVYMNVKPKHYPSRICVISCSYTFISCTFCVVFRIILNKKI